MLRCQSVDEKYKSLLEALDEAREKNDYPMLAEAYYDLAMYEEAHNSNLELSFQQLSRSLDYFELSKDSVGISCLLYTSPSPRDGLLSRMPSSA